MKENISLAKNQWKYRKLFKFYNINSLILLPIVAKVRKTETSNMLISNQLDSVFTYFFKWGIYNEIIWFWKETLSNKNLILPWY